MASPNIGFIGAGQMARALALGFVRANLFSGDSVWASDPVVEARDALREMVPGAHVGDSNQEVIETCDTVVLAVKPQQMSPVLNGISSQVDPSKLIISIAAGVTLEGLARHLSSGARLVRVMPNTPCLVGQGASGYSMGPHTTVADGELVDQLLSTVGIAFRLEEPLLDAVTGLSGSGPAFVCEVLEALCAGAVQMGLPAEIATALANQTLRGTADYLQSTGVEAAELKKRVSSPNGTTVAGLAVLQERGLRQALIAAVEAATRRSEELGGS
ncbi:MAG: pyrroline-5-carboxylate reductase [Planctomycetales bacterium]